MVAGTYAMSFPMDQKRLNGVIKSLAFSAFFYIALACYRWIVYYTPISSLLPESGIYNVDGAIRVIYSNNALILAQIFVLSLFSGLLLGFCLLPDTYHLFY